MRITIIGAGNVATHLSQALQVAGHHIVEVWSHTEASASQLASVLGCTYSFGENHPSANAECYIISVKDDVLERTAKRFIPLAPNALWLHTAGTMPLSLLEGKGAERIGVLYPMQTFSKQKPVDFKQIPIFVEGSKEEEGVAKVLAESISHKVYVLNSEERRHLHLAAVFACNFVNHCYTLSAEVLQEIGMPFEVMLPLIEETANKVHTLAPDKAQTGPAIRHDKLVMNKQLELLADKPLMQQIYNLMSESIQRK